MPLLCLGPQCVARHSGACVVYLLVLLDPSVWLSTVVVVIHPLLGIANCVPKDLLLVECLGRFVVSIVGRERLLLLHERYIACLLTIRDLHIGFRLLLPLRTSGFSGHIR